jgi:hypothetical protein
LNKGNGKFYLTDNIYSLMISEFHVLVKFKNFKKKVS